MIFASFAYPYCNELFCTLRVLPFHQALRMRSWHSPSCRDVSAPPSSPQRHGRGTASLAWRSASPSPQIVTELCCGPQYVHHDCHHHCHHHHYSDCNFHYYHHHYPLYIITTNTSLLSVIFIILKYLYLQFHQYVTNNNKITIAISSGIVNILLCHLDLSSWAFTGSGSTSVPLPFVVSNFSWEPLQSLLFLAAAVLCSCGRKWLFFLLQVKCFLFRCGAPVLLAVIVF